MAALRHPNVVMFMGLCLEPPCIVTEFCARGSLYDVLKKARGTPAFAQQLDWSRRISMALDAAKVLTATLNLIVFMEYDSYRPDMSRPCVLVVHNQFDLEGSWVSTCHITCSASIHVIRPWAP